MSKELDTQVGGNHYKNLAIQPVEYIFKNNLGYFEGCVIKYVTRWNDKGGVQDLEKAKHFLELLIALQEQYAKDCMLSLVQKELAECDSKKDLPMCEPTPANDTIYRYLILADNATPTEFYVGTFEKKDAEHFYPKALTFYSREEAEKFIRFNQAYFSKPPYSLMFYQYGEGERQFYLTCRGLSHA